MPSIIANGLLFFVVAYFGFFILAEMIDILFDDLISSLKFLNRRQLLRFCHANRLTLNIVENHFVEWPAIYSEIKIVKKSQIAHAADADESDLDDGRIPLEFYMELKALNCDCEQQLSININDLWTYKLAVDCKCDRKTLLLSQNRCVNFELLAHKNCEEYWSLLENFEAIPPFRRTSCRVNHLYEQYSFHRDSAQKCCQIFAHKIHDAQSRNSIAKEYIYEHRRQQNFQGSTKLDCPTAFLLRTTNLNEFIAHLKMNFIKIYKFQLKQADNYVYDYEYYGEGNKHIRHEASNPNEHSNEAMFWQILKWILENKKISNGTSCIVDVNLIDELLGTLNKMNQQFLLDSLGKCGILQLDSDNAIYLENLLMLPKMQEMLLKSPPMITTNCTVKFHDFLMIKNFLQFYNPQNDCRRLIAIQKHEIFIITDLLIKDFLQSTLSNTYFLLINDYIAKNRKFERKYYNAATKEYLRIMPAYRYSLEPMDLVPVYLARYSKLSPIADEEFDSFFGKVSQNMAKRIKLCEEEIERQNMVKDDFRSWALTVGEIRMLEADEDEELICSFSAYLAKVFPEFSLNIGGDQNNEKSMNEGRGNAEEFYNAENVLLFGRALLPPLF